MLAVAVCIPVRKKSSPKERAMHKLRWTKL